MISFNHMTCHSLIRTVFLSVAVLPRMHQYLLMLLSQFPGQRRALDELGAGAHDGDELHVLLLDMTWDI
ncbi:MAG: hypothetical protein O8C68_06825 [Candidatus Methanoperedens sp.]|nr:hypothetical protein [Candidatus Methanoperedens sp.]